MVIADFHNDVLTESSDYLRDLAFYEEIGVKVVCSVFRGRRSGDECVERAREFVRRKGRGQYLSFEDAGYLADFSSERFAEFCALQPLAVSLTWNGENELGFGCYENAPLKKEGRRAARALSDRGIAVDAAHLSRRGFFDLLDACECVVNTHTCFSELNGHARNIAADQIGEIIRRKGLVGLTFVGYFLSEAGRVTGDDVVRHIDYFVQKFGYRSLCLGTDFYGTRNLPLDIINYESLSVLVEKLQKIGYNDRQIHAVFHGNLEHFIEERRKKWTHRFTTTP